MSKQELFYIRLFIMNRISENTLRYLLYMARGGFMCWG